MRPALDLLSITFTKTKDRDHPSLLLNQSRSAHSRGQYLSCRDLCLLEDRMPIPESHEGVYSTIPKASVQILFVRLRPMEL